MVFDCIDCCCSSYQGYWLLYSSKTAGNVQSGFFYCRFWHVAKGRSGNDSCLARLECRADKAGYLCFIGSDEFVDNDINTHSFKKLAVQEEFRGLVQKKKSDIAITQAKILPIKSTENIFVDMTFDAASIATPISSGNGDAIMKPATTGSRYSLRRPDSLPLKY